MRHTWGAGGPWGCAQRDGTELLVPTSPPGQPGSPWDLGGSPARESGAGLGRVPQRAGLASTRTTVTSKQERGWGEFWFLGLSRVLHVRQTLLSVLGGKDFVL